MLFFVFSDQGIETQPLEAPDLATAADQLRQRYGLGTGQVRLAVILPDDVGIINQDPTSAANATITRLSDAANQDTLRQQADQALANNATYLGITSPTNAQVVAQVRALTRQVDALIRLAVGDFSGST